MRSLAALLLLLAGCDLYFGGGDDTPCTQVGYGGEPAPAQQLRDPQSGACVSGGGWEGCKDSCGPCRGTGDIAGAPLSQDWGACYSSCNNLDEQACLGTSGCLATYSENTLKNSPTMTAFRGCFATAPSGPIQGGGCWGLDAQACSRHDDCSMYYGGSEFWDGEAFTQCAPEPTTQGCTAVDCGPGSHCEEQCYPCDGKTGPCDAQCSPTCVPDQDACGAVDCLPGYECVTTCEAMDSAPGAPLPPDFCDATCVPTNPGPGDPGSCTGPVSCLTGQPACPANTTAGIANGCWTGYCIPNSACGPNDPGSCTGQVACDALPPACPTGTVAGIRTGCWSGYCIPASACPQAACEALTSESACEARSDCTPVYTGASCTCYPGGCSCEDLTFARCETWGTVMPF